MAPVGRGGQPAALQSTAACALTLEKLKHARGEVLYVTHSAYLAQSARSLYHAHGFEAAEQEPVFLSYREFVESIDVPPGREAQWRDFAAWFQGLRQSIFAPERREAVYALFGKYRTWLAEAGLYDLNLVAQDWLARARPGSSCCAATPTRSSTPTSSPGRRCARCSGRTRRWPNSRRRACWPPTSATGSAPRPRPTRC